MQRTCFVWSSALYQRLLFFASLLIGMLAASEPCLADPTSAIASIRPAVVFVYLPLELETGSGVVVHSDSNGSDIVTAAHVVKSGGEIQIYFEGDNDHPHDAKLVHIDRSRDLALLHIKELAPAQASLASNVASGDAIGILGYPYATSVKRARNGELRPEALAGALTSVLSGGALISSNAATEPGDSGAPIFRQDDGEIVGIVTGHFGSSAHLGFQGTGVPSLRHFLKAEHVAFYGPNGPEGGSSEHTSAFHDVAGMHLLHETRGAHRLLVDLVLDVHWDLAVPATGGSLGYATQSDALAFAVASRKKIESSLEPAFGAAMTDQGAVQNIVSMPELGSFVNSRGYVGAVQEIFTLHTSKKVAGFVDQFETSTKINVIDRYGDTVYTGSSSKTQSQPVSAFYEQQVDGVWSSVTQDAITKITTQVEAAGGDAGKNFGRFGIPLATGQQSAFVSVEPDPRGARVASLFPYGTAARSTLQVSDLIVALDGQDLSNMPGEQLTALFSAHPGSPYRCTVLEPDGQAVGVSFEGEDVRWYLENPLPTKSTP